MVVGLAHLDLGGAVALGALVLFEAFLTALELAADRLVLVDEEDEDVEMRLRETDAAR